MHVVSDFTNDNKALNFAIYGLVLFVLSLAVYKVLMQIHADHFTSLVQATYGVLEGKPHWIAYQNRLLGPSIVYLISELGFSHSSAFKLYMLMMIILENFLLFFLLVKTNISLRNALMSVCVYLFTLILVQHRWFYTWDCIDAIVFTLFAYGIAQNKSLRFFVLLFIVDLINREAALFIALYLVIDSFTFEFSKKRLYLASKKKLIVGSSLIFFGIVYTKIIRDYFFISKSDNLPDASHEVIGNHIYLIENLKNMFFYNLFSINIINTLFILGSILYLIYRTKWYSDIQVKMLLVYCAIMGNILIFGLVNETRMYIILIPFLIFYYLYNDRDLTDAPMRYR